MCNDRIVSEYLVGTVWKEAAVARDTILAGKTSVRTVGLRIEI
jgi:hypothetical protein